MKKKTIQIILIVFGILFMLIGTIFHLLGSMQSTGIIVIYFLAVLLIAVASVDPSSIKKLTASHKGFSIDRYEPSDDERNSMLNIATDEKDIIPREEKERVLNEAKSRRESEKSPEDFLVLSKKALDEKNFDQAFSNAYNGLNLEQYANKTKAALYYQLGRIFNKVGNKELSFKKLQESSAIDPSYGWPLNEMGLLYQEDENEIDAEKMYKKAIEADDRMAISYYNLGELYEKQGRLQDAELNYKKAIELLPSFSPYYVALGSFYYNQKDYLKARPAFENAISKDPKGKYKKIAHTYALNNLGVILMDEGKKEEAVQKYKEALMIDPEFKLAKKNLSSINKDNI